MIIKELRKSAGLTLQQLADIIGTSNQTISNWENEKTEPDIRSLIKLANIFNCSIDYLITGKTFNEEFVLIRCDEYNRLVKNLNNICNILAKKSK